MSWLSRIRRGLPGETVGEEGEEGAPPPVERSAPGIAALFEGVRPERGHALLDLGSSQSSNFALYCRYAQRIRFADVLTDLPRGGGWAEALPALCERLGSRYHLVLAWNALDLLPPAERPLLVRRLAEITAVGARLYVTVDASGGGILHPLRFTLRDVDRVWQQEIGPARAAHPELLPAEVERLLVPFEVRHAFTVRSGVREYVAVRGAGAR